MQERRARVRAAAGDGSVRAVPNNREAPHPYVGFPMKRDVPQEA